MQLRSEDLAYWYLRLNGFLSIQNFIVHPDGGSNQETDVDLMAVRFPFRAENLVRPMRDDRPFVGIRQPYVAFTEVKAGRCSLNGPWTNPERQNMLRVLAALGAFTRKENEWIASELYGQGFFQNQLYRVSLLCFGAERNDELAETFPKVPQLIWSEVLLFIFNRFGEYKRQKKSNGQWDQTGKLLWKKAEEFRRDPEAFCSHFVIV